MKKNINAFVFFCLSAFFMHSYANVPDKNSAPASSPLVCTERSRDEDILKSMLLKLSEKKEVRQQFIYFMKTEESHFCRDALERYLKKLNQEDIEDIRGAIPYVLLGFSLNLPASRELIDKQITKGKFLDWLDVFKASDREAYLKTLGRWVEQTAIWVRNTAHAPMADLGQYGKSNNEDKELQAPRAVPVWNPMIIDKYLDEILAQHRDLTEEEFCHLNILYAIANQSYRDIFTAKMAAVVLRGQIQWLKSFRREQPWAQFRLLAIAKKTPGWPVRRELMWLSRYHQNYKIRAVARLGWEPASSVSDTSK